MSRPQQRVKLGDVLRRADETIAIQTDKSYREITVKLWGRGVVLRGSVIGAEIASSRRFVARRGQFILSRIDARNGALGVVPEELDGAIVTNDFPLFVPDAARLDAGYLGWLSRARSFVELCRRASEGTTNRVRLQEERFLSFEIGLPVLSEQREMVARVEGMVAKLDEVRRLSAEVSDELSSLWQSIVNAYFRGGGVKAANSFSAASALKCAAISVGNGVDRSHNNAHPDRPVINKEGPFAVPESWVWTTVGSVVTHLVDCVNDTPDFSEGDTGFLGLKSTNIRPYRLDLSRKWYMTEADFQRWNRREPPREGDIILTREAPVGFACILPSGSKTCLTQRLMLLRPNLSVIEPMWLLHFLNGAFFRSQIEEHSRGLTTPHIRVQDAPNFLMPLPPVDTQRHILKELAVVHAAIRDSQDLRRESDAMLDAMLPSILNRAFNDSQPSEMFHARV